MQPPRNSGSLTPSTILRPLLGFLTTLTLLHQIPTARRHIQKLPLLSLLTPLWTFFAPTPGTFDTVLLFRCAEDDDLVTSAWRVATPTRFRRGLLPLLHNPYRRAEKCVLDMGLILREYLRDGLSLDDIQYTPTYIQLLRLSQLAAHQRGHKHGFIQFCLMESPGYALTSRDPQIVLASLVHPLDSPSHPKAGK